MKSNKTKQQQKQHRDFKIMHNERAAFSLSEFNKFASNQPARKPDISKTNKSL